MARIKVLDEKIRHEGTPLLSDSCSVLCYLETHGNDSFSLDIPSGYELEEIKIHLASDIYKTGIRIEEQPPPKATGRVKIIIHWWIAPVRDPFYDSFIEYRIITTAVPLPSP